MHVNILTLVLDGMPYIGHHLPVFNRLPFSWTWHVVEGVAAPANCTSWCRKIEPRFSADGTHEYLDSIRHHPRVRLHQRKEWRGGKVEMCNRALAGMEQPGLLWQIDADELWLPHQIEMMRWAFQSQPGKNLAQFYCRYFVGQNIAIVTRGTYGNNPGEWQRVWRFEPGMKFKSHEPPEIEGFKPKPFCLEETEAMGLVFDHYAYATEAQVRLKEEFYGYDGAVEQWKWLQQNRKWPVRVGDFLEWVKDDAMAERVVV